MIVKVRGHDLFSADDRYTRARARDVSDERIINFNGIRAPCNFL